ncbi:MAG: 30S ribosomal protein S17 [Candidatus Moranbacteria bacterium]|nr:30S ribosomal protein S17 [Candidatus Moranbacteria bacterium]
MVKNKTSQEQKNSSKDKKKSKKEEFVKLKQKKKISSQKRRRENSAIGRKKNDLKQYRKKTSKKVFKKPIKKEFKGSVISDKMKKTLVVEVSTVKIHPVYNKRYKTDKKYLVHDPQEKYKVGDFVLFRTSKPISKRKKWIVVYDNKSDN